MGKIITLFVTCLSLFLANIVSYGQNKPLHLIYDSVKDEYGYATIKGDTIIAIGKYRICFTKTFDKFAIVLASGKGFVGIDRSEKILFEVFPFDNGPDNPSNGLFRIIKNGKIGYADIKGNIIIKPQYDCAYPFEKGAAEVGIGCKKETDGEHWSWKGGEWVTIDRKGNVITKKSTK